MIIVDEFNDLATSVVSRMRYWILGKPRPKIAIFQLVLLLLAIPAGVILLDQQVHFVGKAAIFNATVSLPARVETVINKEFSAPVILDTSMAKIRRVDMVIKYDPTKLILTDLVPQISDISVIVQSNVAGKLALVATAQRPYLGSTVIVNLKFKSLDSGTREVNGDFNIINSDQVTRSGVTTMTVETK